MDINNCHLSILYSLLQRDVPASVNQIAAELGMSPKTIRANLPVINCWLKPYDVSIYLSPKLGITLNCVPEQRQSLVNLIEEKVVEKYCFTRENRILFLLFTLLVAKEPVNGKLFQYKFNYSPNTLMKDMLVADEYLDDCRLKLIRQSGVGTYIDGPEINHRNALLFLLWRIYDASDFINIFTWHRIRFTNPWAEKNLVKKEILAQMRDWQLPRAWRAVNKFQDLRGVNIAETDKIRLSLYIAIMHFRFAGEQQIHLTPEQIHLIQPSEVFTDAKQLLTIFDKDQVEHYSTAEIVQLALEMSTMNRVESWSKNPIYNEGFSMGFYKIAKYIIESISNELRLSIVAPSVIIKLGDHLHRIQTCILNGIVVKNPCINEVKTSYPDIYRLVQQTTNSIPEYFGGSLPDAEISFITMYVVLAIQLSKSTMGKYRPKVKLVCPSGGITVEMLLFRLNSELPEIDIEGIMSIYDLERMGPGNVDAIIMTVSSANFKSITIPVITVNPILKPEDVKKIKAQLFSDKAETG